MTRSIPARTCVIVPLIGILVTACKTNDHSVRIQDSSATDVLGKTSDSSPEAQVTYVSGDAGTCAVAFDQEVVTSERSCAVSSDCRLITVSDCCGNTRLLGLAKESTCVASASLGCDPYTCPPPTGPTEPETADDGTTDGDGTLVIECTSGICQTSFKGESSDGGQQTISDDMPICWDPVLQSYSVSYSVPVKTCTTANDCTLRRGFEGCGPGGGPVVGLNKYAECGSPPSLPCTPVLPGQSQPSTPVWTTDSGESTTDFGSIGVRCLAGACRTYVESNADGGNTGA